MTGNPTETEFVDQARDRILNHARKRRQACKNDKLYAVVESASGALYTGIPFETSMSQFDFCAERHAINNMLYAEPETEAFTALLVASPVPDESTPPPTPCGACRHALNEFSDDGTIICTTFVREADGWTMFPQMSAYTASELYPRHHEHPSWN